MLEHTDFYTLRLSQFAAADDIVSLSDWEYLGRLWIGEAIGFNEWLQLEADPDRTRAVALELGRLPAGVEAAILARLRLPIRAGMSDDEVRRQFGEPAMIERFVQDRHTLCYELSEPAPYALTFTIHHTAGLTYITLVAHDEEMRKGPDYE